MKRKILLFIAVVFSASVFAQSGTIMISNDAQSAGRAGTSIGLFDSYELMMTNPAGLSFLKNSSININVSLMQSKTHFKNSINDADGKTEYSPMPDAGYVKKYAKQSKWTWGIGLFTQGGMGADYSLKNELFREQTFKFNPTDSTYFPMKGTYTPQKYHSKFALMEFGPSVAYKISDKFSIGVSIQLVYSMMEFQMPFGMSPSIMAGEAMPGLTFGQLFSMAPSSGGFGYNEVSALANMTDMNTISWTGKIGFAYKPNDKLSFGINFNLPVNLNFKNGKASMDMSKQFEDAMGRAVYGFYQNPSNHGLSLQDAMNAVGGQFGQMGIDLTKGAKANYDLDLKMKMPLSIGYGMSYQASQKLNLSLDFIWTNWADAFDKMTMTMTNGTNSNINKMMGGSGFKYVFPLKWKNNYTIKTGVEYKFSNMYTFRIGYAYNSNPVPSSTIFSVFPAIIKHHLTIGSSFHISSRCALNVAIEAGLKNTLTATSPSEVQSEYSGSSTGLKTLLGHISFNYKL